MGRNRHRSRPRGKIPRRTPSTFPGYEKDFSDARVPLASPVSEHVFTRIGATFFDFPRLSCPARKIPGRVVRQHKRDARTAANFDAFADGIAVMFAAADAFLPVLPAPIKVRSTKRRAAISFPSLEVEPTTRATRIRAPGDCWRRLGYPLAEDIEAACDDPENVTVSTVLDVVTEDACHELSWQPLIFCERQDDGDFHIERVHWVNSRRFRMMTDEDFDTIGGITIWEFLALIRDHRECLVASGPPRNSDGEQPSAALLEPTISTAFAAEQGVEYGIPAVWNWLKAHVPDQPVYALATSQEPYPQPGPVPPPVADPLPQNPWPGGPPPDWNAPGPVVPPIDGQMPPLPHPAPPVVTPPVVVPGPEPPVVIPPPHDPLPPVVPPVIHPGEPLPPLPHNPWPGGPPPPIHGNPGPLIPPGSGAPPVDSLPPIHPDPPVIPPPHDLPPPDLPPVDPSLPVPQLPGPQFPQPILDHPAPPFGHIPFADGPLGDWVAPAVELLNRAGHTVLSVVHDLYHGIAVPAPLIMPALRLFEYYRQDFYQQHNPGRIYRGSRRGAANARYNEDFDLVMHGAARALPSIAGNIVLSIDPWLGAARDQLGQFSDSDRGQNSVMTLAIGEVNTAHQARLAAPQLRVAANAPESSVRELANAFPEFRVVKVSTVHPHGVSTAVRWALSVLCVSHLQRRFPGVRVRGIGLSPQQAAQYPQLVHNCGPELTGRDVYRHRHAYDAIANAAFAQISQNHRFQDCHSNCAPVVVAPFSCGDISLLDFAVECIQSGVHTAYVMLNLPVVFLDSRIRRFRDLENGFLYEREGDYVDMYFTGGASAGYRNRYDTLLSWCSPVPRIDGWHISVEELRRFGSTYLLEVRLAPGPQEVMPTLFKLAMEEFIVLPKLMPYWRRDDSNTGDFAIPARRFRALVSFVSTIEPGKVHFEPVANKLRGQLGEVRIGKTVIENRWDLEVDEFYSVVGHAIIAHAVHSRDYQATVPRVLAAVTKGFDRHSTNPFLRYATYLGDLFTLQLAKHRNAMDRSPFEWLLDAITGTGINHGQFYSPYVPRSEHRVINDRDFVANMTLAQLPKDVRRVGQLTAYAVSGAVDYVQEQLSLLRRQRRIPVAVAPAIVQPAPAPESVAPSPAVAAVDAPTLVRVRNPELVPLPPPDEEEINYFFDDDDSAQGAPSVYLWGSETSDDDAPAGPEELPPGPSVLGAPEAVVEEQRAAPGTAVSPTQVALPPETPQEHELFADFSGMSASSESSVIPIAPGKPSGAIDDGVRELLDRRGQPVTQAKLPTISEGDLYDRFTAAPFRPSAALAQRFQTYSEADRIMRKDYPRPLDITRQISTGRFDMLCPDAGLFDMISEAMNLPVTVRQQELPSEDAIFRTMGISAWDGGNALHNKVRSFYGNPATRHSAVTVPSLHLDGVAGSGKSTAFRNWAVKYGYKGVVVVPSHALKEEWRNALEGSQIRVTMQHVVCTYRNPHFVAIDECYTFARVHLEAWARYATSVGAKLVLLGDSLQRAKDDTGSLPSITDPWFTRRRIRLTISNTMGWDAMHLMHVTHGLPLTKGSPFQTRNGYRRTIMMYQPTKISLPQIDFRGWMLTKPRTSAAGGELDISRSVTQMQGTRCAQHLHDFTLSLSGGLWQRGMLGATTVLISRHTTRLVIVADIAIMEMVFPGVHWDDFMPVNGLRETRLLGQRQIFPFDLDILPVIRHLDSAAHPEIEFAGLPLVSSRRTGETLASFASTYEPPVRSDSEYCVAPERFELQGFVYGRVNFDLAKDHEHAIDFVTSGSRGLTSVGEISYPVTRTDVRNDLDEAWKLADIQVSQSRFEDLRNICERQFQQNKSWTTAGTIWTDAAAIFRRFCACFLADERMQRVDLEDFSVRWLSTRAPAFLQRLADEPFSETARSVRFHAFLKQQVKYKSTPGFPASVNYGQQVIANEAPYSALFGPPALAAYTATLAAIRDDYVPDIGFSDDELSEYCRRRGMLERLSGPNMQVDVEKQDSSHTAEHVLAFCMWLDFLGFDPQLSELYFSHCSSYAVVSQAEPQLYRGRISFNLASGDPFTLLRNFFQMSSTLACRYRGVRRACGVQKGDDLILDVHLRDQHRLATLPAIAQVRFKVDYDKPAYHAGRFVTPLGFFVDPVRAFAKHFARVSDVNVPTAELYQSYISRATMYPAEIQRYFRAILRVTYEDYNDEEIDLILRTVAHLRGKRFFEEYSTPRSQPRMRVEAPTDCAVFVAKFLIPGRPARFYHQFRGRTALGLQNVFLRYGITSEIFPDSTFVPPHADGLIITPSHTFFIRPPKRV
ncbi:polyprotein [Sclerotium rolfsii alphavirus-like virus 1]|uniref:Polyprotein n=1 Tax=Sclerotium rolfsii alphavirus-like virus 1 TaxID=2490819 RepID=A0A3G8EYR5_9VIRU|nr:polyprotein [Sclerotium rolfsii alphavirus-like virus 1]